MPGSPPQDNISTGHFDRTNVSKSQHMTINVNRNNGETQ